MHENELRQLLELVSRGQLDIEGAVAELRNLPHEVLPSARLDHHRQLRTGLPEAVFGESKTVDQLVEIMTAMLRCKNVALATRVAPDKATAVCARVQGLTYHETARMLTGNDHYIPAGEEREPVLIITAGTSDLAVAEEAAIALHWFGHPVERLYDAGVAGIHRLLAHTERFYRAPVIIVVAGMEGALPSVVAGLAAAPVIGVPTSVGYGTGRGGFSALLGMLNSCAPGLAVVNIDNGFGAACMAAAINRKIKK